MWRSDPGCTEATETGGLVPDQVNGSPIGLVSGTVCAELAGGRDSVTITTTSSAVSFLTWFATRSRTYAASQPRAVPTTIRSFPTGSRRSSSFGRRRGVTNTSRNNAYTTVPTVPIATATVAQVSTAEPRMGGDDLVAGPVVPSLM